MGKIDAVEGRQNMIDETGAALLAVGQKIEADLFLSSHVETRGIVLSFFSGSSVEAKRNSTAICSGEPTWTRKTTDGRCGDGRELHNTPRKNFLCLYMRQRRNTSYL